jgi:hypothetical protein
MSGANRTILAWTSVAVRAVTPMATRRAGRGQSATVGRSRLIAGLALFALAAITAIISYLHALAIVRPVGNISAVAYLPFVADLMIPRRRWPYWKPPATGAAKPALAIVSLVFSIGATLATTWPPDCTTVRRAPRSQPCRRWP